MAKTMVRSKSPAKLSKTKSRPKRGKHCAWNESAMVSAMQAVQQQGLSQRAACQMFSVPRCSLQVSPPASDTVIHSMPAEASQEWRATHVRESQYCLQVVRCTDITCCSPWRSSLHQLLPGRFLPNPVPAKQNSEGFLSCNTESNATFLPLFVNLQLNNHVQKDEMGAFVIPPYDLHCPSVQLQLVKRCCSVCGIYHASVKSTVNHVKVHRRTSFGVIHQGIIEKKRPVRVAARRQREMMVVLRDHLNNESAEWLDVEEIDMDLQEPKQQAPAVMPVIENIQQWATNSVWEDL